MSATNLLKEVTVKGAKPRTKPYKLTDGDGMYLLVKPDGSKYWRLKYRYAGREKLLALGVYPDVGLKAARVERHKAREAIAAGRDPGAEKKARKLALRRSVENTFEKVARKWYEKQGAGWSKAHSEATLSRLEQGLFPSVGRLPIVDIDAPTLLDALQKIEKRGALEVAAKTRMVAGQVFRFAIASGIAKFNPTADLKGALEIRDKRHYARLAERDLPDFLAKLETYDGNPLTKLAMKLLVLTFVRTGELRGAKWPEFDLKKREWRIPAERMKMGVEHLVPLSDQAMEVLRELQELPRVGDLVFPNEHHPNRPMSENTILYALYRMGYRGRATGHGFRATASTILNEQKWSADVIERQLAHNEANKVRAAYHHSEYLVERRKMMQAWADFLDAKRNEGDKVVSMARKRA